MNICFISNLLLLWHLSCNGLWTQSQLKLSNIWTGPVGNYKAEYSIAKYAYQFCFGICFSSNHSLYCGKNSCIIFSHHKYSNWRRRLKISRKLIENKVVPLYFLSWKNKKKMINDWAVVYRQPPFPETFVTAFLEIKYPLLSKGQIPLVKIKNRPRYGEISPSMGVEKKIFENIHILYIHRSQLLADTWSCSHLTLTFLVNAHRGRAGQSFRHPWLPIPDCHACGCDRLHRFQIQIEATLNAFKLLYLCPEIILTVSAFFDWPLDFPHFLQSLLYLHLESCWSCSIYE